MTGRQSVAHGGQEATQRKHIRKEELLNCVTCCGLSRRLRTETSGYVNAEPSVTI